MSLIFWRSPLLFSFSLACDVILWGKPDEVSNLSNQIFVIYRLKMKKAIL
ncbi:hypothetical protein ACJW30_07G088400 [Castanea mollissima]